MENGDAGGVQVQAGDISDGAIAGLSAGIERLREIKRSRMDKLQDLLGSMLELWNLMDTPAEEQRQFQGVACTEPGALSMACIHDVEAEVVRLETLKECRMKDLVAKKHEELMEIRRRARLPGDDDDAAAVMVLDAIEQGGGSEMSNEGYGDSEIHGDSAAGHGRRFG